MFTARQQAVLADLEGMFLRYGFRRLTIQELAARLRCSRRTLYELAPSKDELVLLVVDRLLQRTGREAMAKAHALDNPIERVHAYISTASNSLHRETEAFSVDVAAEPAVHRLFQDHYHFATSVVARLIQDGIDRGQLRGVNPQLVAEVLYAGLDRLQEPAVLRLAGLNNAKAIQQLFDLLVYGLAQSALGQQTIKRREVG